jgi:hypothetical protein
MVEPLAKTTGKRSPQQARRAQWEAEKRAGYEIVDARSGGICEVDGCTRKATSHHHRAGRRGPGVNHPSMLLHLCAWCDHRITTDPLWAKEHGYSLDRVSLPLAKPVLETVVDGPKRIEDTHIRTLFCVLNLWRHYGRVTVDQVADTRGMAKSTAHAHLVRLAAFGLVGYEPDRRGVLRPLVERVA